MNQLTQLESLLFWKAEPVSFKKIAEYLNVSTDDVVRLVGELETSLQGRGISVVQTDTDVTLTTSKESTAFIEQLTKDELSKDLGKAGLETLAIILYQGPISRADIDYIRGVNSQFVVRNLLIRGLIERVDNPTDARSFLYKTTIELLSHLGISKITDLPEYASVRSDIESFKSPTEKTSDTIEV